MTPRSILVRIAQAILAFIIVLGALYLFSASSVYMGLLDLLLRLNLVKPSELAFLLISFVGIPTLLLVLGGGRKGVRVFTGLTFLLLLPSILPYSSVGWFQQLGLTIETRSSMLEVLVLTLLVTGGLLILYFVAWFSELETGILKRGAAEKDVAEVTVWEHASIFLLVVGAVTGSMVIGTVSNALKYLFEMFTVSVPFNTVLFGVGLSLLIIGVVYWAVSRHFPAMPKEPTIQPIPIREIKASEMQARALKVQEGLEILEARRLVGEISDKEYMLKKTKLLGADMETEKN